MASKFVSLLFVASVATCAVALDLDFSTSDLYDEEGRLLVIPVGGGTTTGLNLNLTTVAAIASVLASGLVTILGLGALGFLLYSLFSGGGGSGYGSGSGSYGGGGNGGGYSSYSSYRR